MEQQNMINLQSLSIHWISSLIFKATCKHRNLKMHWPIFLSLKSQRYINFQVIWKGEIPKKQVAPFGTQINNNKMVNQLPRIINHLTNSCCLRFVLWESWHKAFKLRLHETPRFTDWQSQWNKTKKKNRWFKQSDRLIPDRWRSRFTFYPLIN